MGSGDHYVSGGVNWAAFTLEELVGMVADKASVPQLERLADDWRQTGDGVVDAADYLAESLDDLMNYWSGETADEARHAVALNAQWVGDLGVAAKDMGDPIEEAAGALKSAQDAMPKLPEVPPATLPGSAPIGAEAAAEATGGSPLGAAVGATAAGTESAFQSQAEQEDLKRVAIETMQRFESAALGIDQATPQLPAQSDELRPRVDDIVPAPGGGGGWVDKVNSATGVDTRWQVLTGMTDTTAAAQRGGSFDSAGAAFAGASGGSAGGFGGGAAAMPGPVAGPGTLGDTTERVGGVMGGRGGLPVTPSGAVPSGGAVTNPGMTGPVGAPMGGMGSGGEPGGQAHRRRVPFDGDDPFDTGEKASPSVIGL